MRAPEEAPYLTTAAAVAATIHAQHDRLEVSRVAAFFGLQAAGEFRLLAELEGTHPIVNAMTEGQRADVGRRVAAALRPGADAVALADGHRVVAVLLRSLTALALLTAKMGLPALIPQPDDELPLTTLAGALAAAGDPRGDRGLAARLTRPALDCAITIRSDRSPPQVAHLQAERLAELALRVLPSSPVAGIRLGLESHALFDLASREQVLGMRYQFQEPGSAWARVLLAVSAAHEEREDPAMALDLAAWAGGVALQLVPFAVLDADVRALARDCLLHHGRLLIATGDLPAG